MTTSPPSFLPEARLIALRAARTAGAILTDNLGKVREIRFKGEIDLVTEVDLASEQAIVQAIAQRFPGHRILAEEGSVGGADPSVCWIIDPLDGTTNYSHGLPFFCVSIGLEIDGRVELGVIYDPLRDELFEARRGEGAWLNDEPIQASNATRLEHSLLVTGFPYDRARFSAAMRQFENLSGKAQAVRRLGSAALDLCYVACGRLDAYWEGIIMPWDVAGGSLIVTEAGGVISSPSGEPFDVHGGSVLASAPGIHEAMLDALRDERSASAS